ncbi:noelin [Lingula anatina]|uniref:Noelin n=1 Tax=Lingula anatina TaxID=7574 RepID=A0A1S3JIM1_LINAN|nr:noelin [Lingula anatina]|eukprot:XP_013409749.1 noelin [Lingula anatina]
MRASVHVVFYSCLVHIVLQTHATDIGAQELPQEDGRYEGKYKYTVRSRDRHGRCICTVMAKQKDSCSEEDNFNKLKELDEKLKSVNVTLQLLKIRTEDIPLKIANLTKRFDVIEKQLARQSLEITLSDAESIRSDLSELTDMVEKIEKDEYYYFYFYNRDGNFLGNLETKLFKISSELDSVRIKNPLAINTDLTARVQSLQGRLEVCRSYYDQKAGSSPFRGDAVAVEKIDKSICKKRRGIALDQPITHTWMEGLKAGAWFKDPLPRDDASKKRVFYMVTQYHTPSQKGNYVYGYENYTDFIGGELSRQAVYPIIFFSGTGSVVYNGSLYYADYDTSLKRYDLSRGTVVARNHIRHSSLYLYNRGGRTYIDLNVDEKGMWAVYTTDKDNGYLIISKLDPDNLSILKTWRTNRLKTTVSNVFFVCGVMYTMDSYQFRLPGEKQYVFDTETGKEYYQKIAVPSKYGAIYQLSYNPRERMIFAWDNGHLLTYPLQFLPDFS